MSRYIDKDKLIERLKMRSVRRDCKFCNQFEVCVKNNSRKGSHLNCWEMIDMPEADVVEVVRCKDCKYYDKYEWCGKIYHRCLGVWDISEHHNADVNDNDYCSYGERKENEQ